MYAKGNFLLSDLMIHCCGAPGRCVGSRFVAGAGHLRDGMKSCEFNGHLHACVLLACDRGGITGCGHGVTSVVSEVEALFSAHLRYVRVT